MKITRAMILAAGLGTRMRPLTNTMPKPLVPVAGKPLIDWCLDWLQEAGIENVIINSSYRAAQLEDHLATRLNPHITISREPEPPLETGGGVAKALPLLGDEPFLTMNSDAIFPNKTTHPIAELEAAWDDALDFLMLIVPKEKAFGWTGQGDFIMDENGRLRRPKAGEDAPYLFTGVEIIHPRVFENHPEGAFSLSQLWKQREDSQGWFRNIRAIVLEGTCLNVGDLAGLKAAEEYPLIAGVGR